MCIVLKKARNSLKMRDKAKICKRKRRRIRIAKIYINSKKKTTRKCNTVLQIARKNLRTQSLFKIFQFLFLNQSTCAKCVLLETTLKFAKESVEESESRKYT
ncbi:hypothetical protein PUN28_015284 [Cardiocondyla obscurior]|uniref:Ribosomal protein L20 n=1 Tax=Cardiocondyla obscurior TaxID=286306 RepID=A0AAW2EY59_9HYME